MKQFIFVHYNQLIVFVICLAQRVPNPRHINVAPVKQPCTAAPPVKKRIGLHTEQPAPSGPSTKTNPTKRTIPLQVFYHVVINCLGYTDVDNEDDLTVLQRRWRDTNSEEKKDYIVRRIQKLNSKGKLMFGEKLLSEVIFDEYVEVKLDKLVKQYGSDESEDLGPNTLVPFNDDPFFCLYYDLNTGDIIGPLSLMALNFVNNNGDKNVKRMFSVDPGTDRAFSDAKKIKQYDKDPSKIMIYSK